MENSLLKFIDLSRVIVDEMPGYPGDKGPGLRQDKFFRADGHNDFRLETGMHAGTHVDGPMHMTDSKILIGEIPLDRFVGKGCLLDVRGQKTILPQEKYEEIIKAGDVVLLYTNYSEKYGTDEYFHHHPVVSEALADLFIEKKIKMLAMDLPSPDRHPFVIHKKLLKNDILIAENLTNLSALSAIGKFYVMAFPLKIEADSSPARILASTAEIFCSTSD